MGLTAMTTNDDKTEPAVSCEAVTRGVRVRVKVTYVPQQSRPDAGEWFFAYRVTIANEGTQTVQLISRHWVITDSSGHIEHVRGPGVVGKQPRLGPGAVFEYTSFCPLPTSFGTMHGEYQMVSTSGEHFDVEIPPFSLHQPYAIN